MTLVDRDDFFHEPRNLFLHGVIESGRGTCTSLPTFYLAVGRRLGYPLKLVRTKSHRFARWEGGRERFNIECTSHGFVSHPDEHYRTFPIPASSEEVCRFDLLKSKSPRQELAAFVADRGICLLDNGLHEEAAESFAWANELHPECHLHGSSFVATLNRWKSRMSARAPGVRLPGTRLRYQRRFSRLPEHLENGLVDLACVEDWINITRRSEEMRKWKATQGTTLIISMTTRRRARDRTGAGSLL